MEFKITQRFPQEALWPANGRKKEINMQNELDRIPPGLWAPLPIPAIKYLVRIGVQMLIAKQAVEKIGLSPQTAIIAGFGLQVLAGALQAAFNKKLQGFASGTTGVQEGGVYNVGERGPERIFLPRGAQVQPANEVQAYGGGREIFIPAVTLSGSNLVIAFNRASQQMSRNG